MDIRDTVSGGVGSVFCTYAGIPFDTVKVRLQTSKTNCSALRCAISMLHREGPRAFFRGATPALASAFVENTVVFTAHGALGRWLHGNRSEQKGLAMQMLQHSMSGACSSTAICPPEVVKVRLQSSAQPMTRDAVLRVVRELWNAEGALGFFRGIVPLWGRDIPFYSVFFGTYELLTTKVFVSKPEKQISAGVAFLCGGLAGSVSWAAVFPFDVVKSRQQASSQRGAAASFGAIARSILASSGPKGFFSGLGPACIRGFPANGALFMGVELTNRLWSVLEG